MKSAGAVSVARRASREIREVQHDQHGSSSADVNRKCEKRIQKIMVFACFCNGASKYCSLSFHMFPTGRLDFE